MSKIDFAVNDYLDVLKHYKELYNDRRWRPLVKRIMPDYNGKDWWEERDEMLKRDEENFKRMLELGECMRRWYENDRKHLW